MRNEFSKIVFMAGILLAFIGCASTPPPPEPAVCWQKEHCLAATYPESQWYFAFAEDTVGVPREALERQALGKMIERIKVDISSRSSLETRSDYRSGSEDININFAKTTQVSADAEVVNSFTDSYNDSKRVYAFAAVRKADLALYYAKKIEFALGEAHPAPQTL